MVLDKRWVCRLIGRLLAPAGRPNGFWSMFRTLKKGTNWEVSLGPGIPWFAFHRFLLFKTVFFPTARTQACPKTIAALQIPATFLRARARTFPTQRSLSRTQTTVLRIRTVRGRVSLRGGDGQVGRWEACLPVGRHEILTKVVWSPGGILRLNPE